ncbi:MAG: class I SAM-dependent methyltransferase [Acidobacteria bacterium]|nr:class I SAM-dependent methyltransferase [Acidobacteriota bacterium]
MSGAVAPALVPGWVRTLVRGRAKSAVKTAVCSLADLWPHGDPLLPPARLRVKVGCFLSFLRASEYRRIAAEFMAVFEEAANPAAGSRVLDIGCGCGQIAVPLLSVLGPKGRYEGFDPDPELLEWCADRIESRFPNFRFSHADLANKLYNPDGAVRPESYSFPYEDGAFDVILLKSVFTHMQRPSVSRYLGEVRRMLAPGGRCVASVFLLNAESREGIAAGRARFEFPFQGDGCYVADAALPEYLVAYGEDEFRQMAEIAGLEVDSRPLWGTWCGRRSRHSFQDVTVLRCPRS